MNNIIKKAMGIETPRESAQAVDRMADSLSDMDKAQGIFGESMLDEELDEVAGGAIKPIASARDGEHWAFCKVCGTYFSYSARIYGWVAPTWCSSTCRDNDGRH